MTLPRTDVVAGMVEEYGGFGALVRSLGPDEWAAPTRCAGWTVADVAAHVTGTLADVAAGRLANFASPDVTSQQVAERRGRSPWEIADELDGAAKATADLVGAIDDAGWEAALPVMDITVGQGVERLWFDTYVHGDDIRHAIGRPSERGPGLRTAAAHLADILTSRGWGPATLELDGIGEWPVSGGGRTVAGDPLVFVLAATGRTDPAALGLDETVNVYRP